MDKYVQEMIKVNTQPLQQEVDIMDVINNILGEKELSYFNSDDFGNFLGVMDDNVARQVKRYLNSPEADQNIVDYAKKYIGDRVESLTMHFTLQEMGITQLLSKLSPEVLLSSEADIDDIYDKLKFLEQNVDKLLVTIPARPKSAFEQFKTSVQNVIIRMGQAGEAPTYPEIPERIAANMVLFYKPNDKGHSTGAGIVNSRRNSWLQCLRGIEYTKYCDEHGVNAVDRRAF